MLFKLASLILSVNSFNTFTDIDKNALDSYADYSYIGVVTRQTPVKFKNICTLAEKNNLTIRITINTYGGNAFAGHSLCRLSDQFKTYNIAGGMIGAHSAGAVWWMGGEVREFEDKFSTVSFHRAYASIGDVTTYKSPLVLVAHIFGDNLINKHMNGYLSKILIQYLNEGMDYGPKAVVIFQNTPVGVLVVYDNGEDDPKLLVKPTHLSMKEWKDYCPQ